MPIESIVNVILSLSTAFLVVLIFSVLNIVANFFFQKKTAGSSDLALIRQITLFGIVSTGLLILILSFPWPNDLRAQIGSLLGIVVSGVLAFSSATFIGNMLAGILLRAINNFSSGDFINVQEYFGRVSERGLFHTELQTVDRDLITLPNLFSATNPVKVTRSSGTFISGEVSLGYDVSRKKIETCLIDAAKQVGLKDPYVHITSLGDFSVVYKIHGMLEDVKKVLTAKSDLNGAILDALHNANVEIVSPSFMNQRQTGETIFMSLLQKEIIFTKCNFFDEVCIFRDSLMP